MPLASSHVTRTRRFLAVALLLLLFTGELVHVAHLYSANWDEAHHVYDGYRIWTLHDYRLNAEVPPLLKLAAALPLLPMHLTPPKNPGESQALNAFLMGRAFVFGNGGDRVLFPARMACTLFTLVLAWLIYAVGRHLFGTLAGLLALFLFIFDPLVLAHGTLVSTDVGSALFLFAATFAWLRYTEARTPASRLRTGISVGLLAGLALAVKFTGILIVPMLLLLCAAEALRLRSWPAFGRRLAATVGMLALAWLVLWGFYGFRYAPAPNGLQPSPALAPYLASLPNPHDATRLAFLARFHLFPEAYLWGLANTRHTEWEYTSYFFGRLLRHGPWQYFPTAFLIKSTLPLLLLLVLVPLLWRSHRSTPDLALNQGPTPQPTSRPAALAFLLLPVAVYFAVITSSHFDIGARHLMPVYPFLYVLAGSAAALALRRGPAWATVAALLLGWQVVTSVRVAPAYMAYGNEAWGGPLAVRHYLSDANVDWGQQLKSVKRYLDANHITNCWFGYFPDGAVQPGDYGIPCKRLPTPTATWWMDLPMDIPHTPGAPPVIDGTVLLSESVLDGVESGDGPLNPYAAFQNLKPVAILQDGVYVYQGHFAVPLAAAWLDVRRSEELEDNNQPEAALAVAREAVILASNSTRAQLNLATLLAKQNQWPEAQRHFQAAQHWLQTNRPALEQEDFGPPINAGLASAQAHLQ